MKVKLIPLVCFLFSTNLASSKPNELPLLQDTLSYVREYISDGLKGYAFCKCLRHSFDGNEKLRDSLFAKDGTIGGYLHTREISWHHFEILDSMASIASKTIYSSKGDKSLTLMKCLDFYNSKKLDSVVMNILRNSELDWNTQDERKSYMHMYKIWNKHK